MEKSLKTAEDKSENEPETQLKAELENSRQEIEKAQETIQDLENKIKETQKHLEENVFFT